MIMKERERERKPKQSFNFRLSTKTLQLQLNNFTDKHAASLRNPRLAGNVVIYPGTAPHVTQR